MKLRGALLAASLLALPIAASAQPVTGLYIGAGVGVNFMQQRTRQVGHRGGRAAARSTPEPQARSAVGSVGWGFGNGLRAELEGDYRHNDFPTQRHRRCHQRRRRSRAEVRRHGERAV